MFDYQKIDVDDDNEGSFLPSFIPSSLYGSTCDKRMRVCLIEQALNIRDQVLFSCNCILESNVRWKCGVMVVGSQRSTYGSHNYSSRR